MGCGLPMTAFLNTNKIRQRKVSGTICLKRCSQRPNINGYPGPHAGLIQYINNVKSDNMITKTLQRMCMRNKVLGCSGSLPP